MKDLHASPDSTGRRIWLCQILVFCMPRHSKGRVRVGVYIHEEELLKLSMHLQINSTRVFCMPVTLGSHEIQHGSSEFQSFLEKI